MSLSPTALASQPLWSRHISGIRTIHKSTVCIIDDAALPLLGHMHPPFISIMDEIQEGLRYLFQTKSKYVLLVSGTGHAGVLSAI